MAMITNIGYPSINQQQYGDHYPLVFPSSDIQFLIADMSVTYDDVYHATIAPLYITDLDLDNSFIRIVDDSVRGDHDNKPRVVFDSSYFVINGPDPLTSPENYYDVFKRLESQYDDDDPSEHLSCVFSSKEYGDIIYDNVKRYTIYYWSSLFCTVKLVVRNQFRDKLPLRDIHEQIDPRACTVLSDHVRSINTDAQKHVVIQAGNNILLTKSGNTITINAVPGAGEGRIKSTCTESHTGQLYTLNGIESNRGNVVISTLNDGYSVALYPYPSSDPTSDPEEELTETEEGTGSYIAVQNSNTPCCTSEDYNAVKSEVHNVSGDYYGVGEKTERTRKGYVKLLEDYRACATCVEPIRLNMRTVYCPYFEVLGQFSNTFDQCVKGVSFSINFNNNVAVVRNHGMKVVMNVRDQIISPVEIDDTPTCYNNTVSLSWSDTTIPVGDTVYSQFRVYLTNPIDPGSNSLTASVSSYQITLQDNTVINSNLNPRSVTKNVTCPTEAIDNSDSFTASDCEE